ncbi:uncharacterized protein LOC129947866 [Eupeodes corollae]|uniref:uncharacterized protein LOC129947866 n=1 Tax=Eupeodes corollae TaxID=290404 RepID=UPI0024931F08|nr:uncharacterized protein LOC129947866 [Eupeodes corollae]
MKTFLCILAVASVANATLELPSFLGGGSSGGRPRGGPRLSSGGGGGGLRGGPGGSLIDSLGSSLGNTLGEGLGEGLKGITKILGGGGPAISTHHQLDHNVNVVHHYASQNGGNGGDGAQVVEVVGDSNGAGWQNAAQPEVRVIRVIHEDAASAHHSHGQSSGGYGSGGHVQIIKVLHQQAPAQGGW